MRFVVKLSPEIIVKSAAVRRRFIRQLRRNLRTQIEHTVGPATITGNWDRIEIDAPITGAAETDIARVLAHTPGIHSFARVSAHPLGDIDAMAEQAWNHYGKLLAGKKFVVRVKRSGNNPYTSPQLEREIGGRLLARAADARVSLRDPDVTVRLDVVDDRFYVLEQQQSGLGGFPLGQQPRCCR